ncbi:30S ribosomal protein S7 [archaeon]|jgi:small subunit ribosomal protein S7|nr:30S ribosomal protein S7 [archaeon]MDP6547656.1 30S ribosomal protein S7 [Candidatus Woesearchaeota archaeon]|tara:strand:+ start:12495 stop:13088 length:594 start_codon:yes stop_codon:yes gene_type:complete
MIKVFDRWSMEGIAVDDAGLKPYITLEPRVAPKTGARYAKNRFHKSRIFIVERLINKIMIPGHKGKKHFKSSGRTTGKANKSLSIMENVFTIIEKQTKENPLKVFVKALENAAPREEIITIEYGGARYPKAVECAPQRRVDVVLRHMVQGAYHKSFNSKKPVDDYLAEEILNAYRLSSGSHAISKKLEVERQADASR